MNDPRLDRDAAERMLRGDRTGPERLAGLLAAASAIPPAETTSDGEEAAVAAFRAVRSRRSERPSRRRLPALVSLKAVLIGIALLLVGGTAVAATTQHLPDPLRNHRPHSSRTPATSNTYRAHVSPPRPAARIPYRKTPSAHGPGSRPTPHRTAKAHPSGRPNGKASKNKRHKVQPAAGRSTSGKY